MAVIDFDKVSFEGEEKFLSVYVVKDQNGVTAEASDEVNGDFKDFDCENLGKLMNEIFAWAKIKGVTFEDSDDEKTLSESFFKTEVSF